MGIRSLRWEGPWPAVGVADGVALGVLEGDGGHQEVHLRGWTKGGNKVILHEQFLKYIFTNYSNNFELSGMMAMVREILLDLEKKYYRTLHRCEATLG